MIVAIVPAAGKSSRMQRSKPLLPIDGRPMIGRIVETLKQGGAEWVFVLIPPENRPESAAIFDAVAESGGTVIELGTETADMRSTIQFGLDTLAAVFEPTTVLLCPGDTPGIDCGLVKRIIEECRRHPNAIVVPRAGAKRGHPVAIPWSAALSIRDLPPDKGVNALFDDPNRSVREVVVDDPNVLADLDTPDDFRRWSERRAL